MYICKGGLGVKSNFYTLKGYKLKEKNNITEAMEDYIEMIYRKTRKNKYTTIKELANFLNVKPSSVSKMANRLKCLGMIEFEKYGKINSLLKTIGYQEFIDYLDGLLTYEECVDKIKQNTRRYAKRQLTWFRRNEEINWLEIQNVSTEEQVKKSLLCLKDLL